MADLGLSPPNRTASELPAVELLRRTLEGATSPVTLVALAPRTNIAMLLRTHPEVAARIERIVVTGGAVVVDDGNAAMDFNVWHDPDAAAVVLKSGLPMTAYGLDVFYEVTVDAVTAEEMAASIDAVSRLAGLLIGHQVRRMGPGAATIGDAGAVASVIAPDLLTTVRRAYPPDGNEVDVAVAADADRARDLFCSVITAGG
jgi:pyrimidine-specific ribonucleoside hydrolase